MAELEKQKIVCPGDFLGVEEEFSPGINTFGDSEGNVFSTSIGKPVYDKEKRIVSVARKGRMLKPLSTGATVLGQVQLVKQNSVVIMLFSAEKNGKPEAILTVAAGLPISRVSRSYVEDLSSFFRIGDIVKASVAMVTKQAVDLETTSPELGVVKGYCTKCRNELESAGLNLKCPNCGSIEQRKISKDYGKI